MSLEPGDRPEDKVMFEIYREAGYNRRYRVVYYTELTEKNKAAEINRAMAGEHLYDGFLRESTKKQGKQVISEFLEQLNSGAEASVENVMAGLVAALAPYAA